MGNYLISQASHVPDSAKIFLVGPEKYPQLHMSQIISGPEDHLHRTWPFIS